MHRRIDVAECPLVGGQLSVRMHVPFAGQQHELGLGEIGVDQCERHAMKGQIPRGVPRILPFVRHRDDVGIVQVGPIGVPTRLAAFGRVWLLRVSGEPFRDVEIIELLRPEHPGQRLTLDETSVGVGNVLLQSAVELVRFLSSDRKYLIEVAERRSGGICLPEAQS